MIVAEISVGDRLGAVREAMARSARQSGRDAAAVSLVAVSKKQSSEQVLAAYAAGQRCFGENQVQEATAKFLPLRTTYTDIELWLIGALQTNKVGAAVKLFDVIATLDRPKLAETLAQEMTKQQRWPKLLVEVNLGNEPQKAGIAPAELACFLATCQKNWQLPIIGLMCIPPHGSPPESYFRQLASLADEHNLPVRSMGMSDDYATAIACGSTHVRLGTALFGARPIPKIV